MLSPRRAQFILFSLGFFSLGSVPIQHLLAGSAGKVQPQEKSWQKQGVMWGCWGCSVSLAWGAPCRFFPDCRPSCGSSSSLILTPSAAHHELLLLFPALPAGLELCGLGFTGRSFNAGSVLFSRSPALSWCHFSLVTHLKPGWAWSSHLWGLLLMSKTKCTAQLSRAPALPWLLQEQGWEPSALCLQFSSVCSFYRLRVLPGGFYFALWHHRPSHEGDFVLVVSEGSSLAVAPFAHFCVHKTIQNYYLQTSLFTTWSCGKTTVFNLNRFLDFNYIYIYITTAFSVSYSFSSTHLPLHLYFMKILGFGHFCCCPAVV